MMGPFWEYAQSQRTWRDNVRDALIVISLSALPLIIYGGIALLGAALDWYELYADMYVNSATVLPGTAGTWTAEMSQFCMNVQNTARAATHGVILGERQMVYLGRWLDGSNQSYERIARGEKGIWFQTPV